MQKVFSLKPSDAVEVKNLQALLDIGFKVVHATPNKVAVAIGGSAFGSERAEGRIVYILEKDSN